MNPLPPLSIAASGACAILSIMFFFKSSAVQAQQSELQKQQQELLTQQQAVTLQQQQLQAQQQSINQGTQLAQQIGPAVLNDLGLIARDNKNENIRRLLEKYGVRVSDGAAAGNK